ncbi:hypothetical protein ACFLYT_01665 [Nanoarchaeota archaeon]
MNSIKHHTEIVKAHEIKTGMLQHLHDEDTFNQIKPGRDLIWMKNLLYDLKIGDKKLFEEFVNSINEEKPMFDEFKAKVLPLLREKEYLVKAANAIRSKNHSCEYFMHFIENLDEYVSHANDNFNDKLLVAKLNKHKHLLNTIYYKEELEHFNETVHNDNCLNELVLKFGDKGKDALRHLVKSHNETWVDRFRKFKSKDEQLQDIADEVSKRAGKLNNAAKWHSKRILNHGIKKLKNKVDRLKKGSANVLDGDVRHYKKVSKLHDRMLM